MTSTIGAQIISGSAKEPLSSDSDKSFAVKNAAAAAGKVKVNISADTERGEATGIGIVGAGVAIPGSIAGKSNLAMAGGSILGDKSSLLKKKTDAASTIQPPGQPQIQGKKNPFTQRRQTAGQGFNNQMDPGKIPGGIIDPDNSDDTDNFDEFYNIGSNQAQKNSTNLQKFDQNVRKFHGDQMDYLGDYDYHGGQNSGSSEYAKLNRNISQQHLAAAAQAEANQAQMDNQKEVELKAQGENSQLFQDSIQQNTINQSVISVQTRQSRLGQSNQLLTGAGVSILQGGHQNFQGFSQGHGHIVQEQKINLNLEDVVLHEQKLNTILDNLRNDMNASLSCEDWWDLTESTDLYQIICIKLIKDIQLRQLMIQAQKYETMAVGIVQFYHLIASEQETIDTKTSVNTYLKNLMHYIHQNFLVAAKFIQSRIIRKDDNMTNLWIKQLKEVIDQKITKQIRNKSEAVQMLRVNIENEDNIIKNIIRANQRKQFFNVLNLYISRLPLFPNDKIRDTLYNIEQFKFDALLQPEIKLGISSSSTLSSNSTPTSSNSGGSLGSQTTSSNSSGEKDKKLSNQQSGMAKKMIKDSDKSSGTNNLIGSGGGSTTLTGKNPFAILKASAIAASQKAVFPNNFTNLPKATPPFLPPLDDVNDRYTLVLDLDETLIHNVDYGQDSFFLVRPGCVQFIELMAQYYEIVIFTAALQEYADQVVDQIDVGNNIKYRLYRQHTSQNGPFLVKDLSLLGRDLNKTIIIDNISDNFILQPDNGIFISTWYDDMSDNFLKEITPLLVELVEKRVPDVRVGMRSYRDQILRQISSGQQMGNISFK